MTRRTYCRAAAFGVAAVTLASITGPAWGAEARTPRPRGGDIVFGQEFPSACLSVWVAECYTGYSVRIVADGNILQGLLTANPTGRYIPQLATKVPSGSDVTLRNGVLSVLWHIQPAARWADGVPVTTDDVIFTKKVFLDPKVHVPSRIGWNDVARIQKIDPKTFRVIFRRGRTYAPWKEMLSLSSGGWLLPAHILGKAGLDLNTVWNNGGFDSGVPFVGSGPYQLKSYAPDGTAATIVPSPRYWGRSLPGNPGGGPNVSSITFRSGLGSTGVIVGIKSGELDLAQPLPNLALVNQIPGTRGISLQARPSFGFEAINLNTQAFPLNHVAVRRALAYALDRQGVASGLLGNQVKVLNSYLGANQFGHVDAWKRYTYDPARAKRILQSDGWSLGSDGIFQKDGARLSITVLYSSGNTQRLNNLTYLAAKAKAAGIELVPRADPNIFSGTLIKGDFQAAEYGLSGSADPSETYIFGADQIPTQANGFVGGNVTRYIGISRLTHASDYAFSDPAKVPPGDPSGGPKRLALIQQMQRVAANDVPLIPLYSILATVAAKSTLVGPQVNATGVDVFWNSPAWFFKGSKA